MKLHAGGMSDPGRVRATNEDAFVCRPDLGLFVVCDGMGGAAAGEVASHIAVKTIVDEVQRARVEDVVDRGDTPYLVRTLLLADAIHQANTDVFQTACEEHRFGGMGTTVVALWAAANVASVVHAGDSRAYRWHDGAIQALTRDHSLAEEEVRAGLIDRERSMQSEHQNVLLRALGPEEEVDLELNEVSLGPGDFLLLCSDGLTRTVADAELQETIARLKDPERICSELIATANRNGAPDNVTVVVVEVVS